jgi:hypothetical protein
MRDGNIINKSKEEVKCSSLNWCRKEENLMRVKFRLKKLFIPQIHEQKSPFSGAFEKRKIA